MLQVGVVGINHKTGDLHLREAIARASEYLFFVHNPIVLSTCNRTEIYFSVDALAEAHCDFLCALRRFISGPFEHRLYSYFGADCFMHLCRVTAGLDSAIVGESDIQRQVKQAYLQTTQKRKIPSPLHFLFQKSLKIAKEIRSRKFISQRSLAQILWEIIRKQNAEQGKTLFVGHSQINREVIAFFRKKGMTEIDICSRQQGFLGREILTRWDDYSLIIAATCSPHYLIEPKKIDSRPRLLFDLSVPRVINPAVGDLFQATLFNIEQIHHSTDEKEIENSHRLLRENVARLCVSYRRKLKFCMARIAREGDHITDVFHAGHEEQKSLKA